MVESTNNGLTRDGSGERKSGGDLGLHLETIGLQTRAKRQLRNDWILERRND
jgi:hypothetical protein